MNELFVCYFRLCIVTMMLLDDSRENNCSLQDQVCLLLIVNFNCVLTVISIESMAAKQIPNK
jgi:hypothetical protein